MRKMKRTLALVVACVLALGLMIPAASAYTYGDQKDITAKYVPAINMLYELQIMQGTSGNFKPQEALNRAELAKMVFVVYNGGATDASYYNNSNKTFTDLGTVAWAKGYINWAKANGVVSGTNAAQTLYNPMGKVSPAAAAKTLLVAMGYDSVLEKFQDDADWGTNILNKAFAAGLLTDISVADWYGTITREQMAQMVYNALFAKKVAYSDTTKKASPISATLADNFGFETLTGTLVGNDKFSLGTSSKADVGKSLFQTASAIISGSNPNGELTLPVAADISLVGREVNVYAKVTKNAAGVVIGVTKVFGAPSLTGNDKVYNTNSHTVKFGASNNLTYSAGNVTSTVDLSAANTVLYINYVNTTATGTDGQTLADANIVKADNPVTLICDKSNVLKYAIVRNYTFVKLTVNSAGKVSAAGFDGTAVSNFSTLDKDKIIDASGVIANGAYAMAYRIGSGTTGTWVLDPVTELTGKVASPSNGGNNVVINGTTYTASRIAGATGSDSSKLNFAAANYGVEKTYWVWGGKLLGCKDPTVAPAAKYCVAIQATVNGNVGSTASITVQVLTGTEGKKTATLTSVGGSAPVSADWNGDNSGTNAYKNFTNYGKLYKYTLTDDGKISLTAAGTDIFTVNAATTANTLNIYTALTGTTLVTGIKNPKLVAASGLYFIENSTGWAVYTSKNSIPVFGTAGTDNKKGQAVFSSIVDDDDTISVMVIPSAGSTAPVSDTVVLRGLLTKPPYADDLDGTMVHYYEMIVNGTKVTYTAAKLAGVDTAASSTNVPDLKAGTILTATGVDGTKLTAYKNAEALTTLATTVSKSYGGYFAGNNGDQIFLAPFGTTSALGAYVTYTMASGAKIYSVNASNEAEEIALSDIGTLDTSVTASGKWQVAYSLDANGKIAVMFVGTGNLWG